MKVLILGSDGMLGQGLCKAFKSTELTYWDKKDLDITQERAVRKKIVKLSPDVVINAAAYTNVDGAEKERELAFKTNEEGVKNIAGVTRDIGSTLVHYSTDYVFSGTAKEGYAENDPPGPAVNTYGESKLAGERVIIESGVKFYLIRTAWLYGLGGKNFIETMLSLAEDNKKIRVVDDQSGNPTYAQDLAEATKKIVNGEYDYGIYHIVNSGVATWCDFAKEIFSKAGIDVEVEPIKSTEFKKPANRPKWSVLNNNKGPEIRLWKKALNDYLKERQ